MRLYDDLAQSDKDQLAKICQGMAIAGMGYIDPESLYTTIAQPWPHTDCIIHDSDRLPDKALTERRLRAIGDEIRAQAGH